MEAVIRSTEERHISIPPHEECEVLVGLGMGLSFPMLGVLTLKLAPRQQQGTYTSALQLGAALCTSAALATGGLLFSILIAAMPTAAFASVFALAALFAATAWISVARVTTVAS